MKRAREREGEEEEEGGRVGSEIVRGGKGKGGEMEREREMERDMEKVREREKERERENAVYCNYHTSSDLQKNCKVVSHVSIPNTPVQNIAEKVKVMNK